jgi:hypothetical protein
LSASDYPLIKLTDHYELHEKWHIVYADNWFSSVNAMHRLFQQGIHFVGTVRTNRKGIPGAAVFQKSGPGVQHRGAMKCMKLSHEGCDYYINAW